jgi:tetrahydromethanopterin:alpha-L-glutamate ligase
MIYIIKKPTDTIHDNSTEAVVRELDRMGTSHHYLDLDNLDVLSCDIVNDLIWVCGMKQDASQFEMLNVLAMKNLVINSPDAIATCASKARTSALLLKNGVNTPETLFTSSRKLAEDFLNKYGKVVYKPLYGYDGNGIFPLEQMSELGDAPYYLQKYVENNRDFRVFVINGKAVGAIMRTSDCFAHNIHQGGEGKPVDVTPEMADVVVAAAKAIGIEYCGVDLLETGDSFTVLEVNGTPNWHCMAVPIPRYLAEYLVELEREYKKR